MRGLDLGEQFPQSEEVQAPLSWTGLWECTKPEHIRFLRRKFAQWRIWFGAAVLRSASAGAQLLGRALGAKLIPVQIRNRIWIYRTDRRGQRGSRRLSRRFILAAFHWHGEAFDLPTEATLLASSGAYPHQAFR